MPLTQLWLLCSLAAPAPQLHAPDSVALPVYNALASLAKLPPVGKTANLKKRKLGELLAEAVDEPPKSDKQRRETGVVKEEALQTDQVEQAGDLVKKQKKSKSTKTTTAVKAKEIVKATPKKQSAKTKTEDGSAETTAPLVKKKARGKQGVLKK